jgi:hypothetical protein
LTLSASDDGEAGILAKECGRKSANKYRKLKREVAIIVVYVL